MGVCSIVKQSTIQMVIVEDVERAIPKAKSVRNQNA